jgi:hypothetical protein
MEVVEGRQLTRASGEALPETFLVDVGPSAHILADFGPILSFTEAVFGIQAKRIFAPQISFQIPFLLAS